MIALFVGFKLDRLEGWQSQSLAMLEACPAIRAKLWR
jgi:hypothetical protein